MSLRRLWSTSTSTRSRRGPDGSPAPVTQPGRPRRRPARAVAVVAALATTTALLVGAPSAQATTAAAPAGPAGTAGTGIAGTPAPTPQTTAAHKPTAPVKANCSAASKGHARCFALRRTDIAATMGIRPALTPAGYGPSDLQSAYALPVGAGSGQVVAIVDAYDNPSAEEDLAVYRQQYGLPPCTTANGCFRKVNQRGEAGPYPTADPGWAGEIALDVDMVSAACPSCQILLVEGDDASLANLGESVDTAVALGASYVSNSYGLGYEDPGTAGFGAYYDHPGVAVTVSTGDDGTGPSFPATLGTVTAVGGTSLLTDGSTRGWTEAAWAGAGSGCSVQETKPTWQADPGCPYRVEADVSAVADPATGVAVYNAFSDGGWVVYGGTSVSAPLIAGVYALAGPPVAGTYAAEYAWARPTALNDVTTGDNGSCSISYVCQAGPGYDGPTGWGTPSGVDAFRSGPHGTLRGVVTSAGAPVPDAVVSADGLTARTDTHGAYQISLPVGTYDVTASAYGYRSSSQSGVTVRTNRTTSLSLTLRKAPSRTVSGTVTDGSGHGWPLYARVSVDGTPGGSVYTDPFTGRWSVSLPAGSTWGVHIEAIQPGYQPADLSVPVAGHDVTRDVALTVEPVSCVAPGYHLAYSGTHETFDSGTKPAGWTVSDHNGSGGVWTFDDPGERGNLTGGEGGFAIIDSDYLGQGNAQDTDLRSPPTDLSGDPAPVIDLDHHYVPYVASSASIDVRVGSGPWTTVWQETATAASGHLTIALPMAAHQKDVQVRFHYTGSWDYYWEVDDVVLGHTACVADPGGLVAGFVRDRNTGAPVNGATVRRLGSTDAGVSRATPDDGSLGDGFYWLFSSATGRQRFSAEVARYTTARAAAPVAPDTVTRRDFVLKAGRLAVSPASVSAKVVLGEKAVRPVTLTNTGTSPLHVDLGEQRGGFVIQGKPSTSPWQGVPGAAVQRRKGTFSPLREAGRAATGPVGRPGVTPSADPWTTVADYPVSISNNAMDAGGGKVYSVGGFDGSQDVSSGYAYDPVTLSWSPIADMSETREAPSLGFVGGQLVVTGGWDSSANPAPSTEVYDPASNSWAPAADNPVPHAGSGHAVLDGRLYVVGGCDAVACGSTDVQVYDPVDDSWSSVAPYPVPTSWLACGGLGLLYCAGGTGGSGSTTAAYSYDPAWDSWAPIADLPQDVWGAGSSLSNGQLLVSGGIIGSSSTVTNEGWAFNPSTNAWTALPASNTSTYRLGSACGFYKVGGSTQSGPVTTGAELLPGYDVCGSSGDVPWLSLGTSSVDLAPGASATVRVRVDSSPVPQPGAYTAAVTFAEDTPYPVPPLGVKLVVTPPRTWGKVTGTVSGQACSGTVSPIAGATLQVATWAGGHTLSTAADGTYALWLDVRSNPLTLIAAKDGWAPQTTTVRISRGKTLRQSFTLLPARSCG